MASFLDLTERPHQCLHLHMSKRDVLCAVFEGGRVHTEGEAGKPQLGQKAGRPGQQRAREEPGAGGASPCSRHHEAPRPPHALAGSRLPCCVSGRRATRRPTTLRTRLPRAFAGSRGWRRLRRLPEPPRASS